MATKALPRPHRRWGYVFMMLLGAAATFAVVSRSAIPRAIDYSEFLGLVHDGKVAAVVIDPDGVNATLKAPEGAGQTVRAERLPGIEGKDLLEALRTAGGRVAGNLDTRSWASQFFLSWNFPAPPG